MITSVPTLNSTVGRIPRMSINNCLDIYGTSMDFEKVKAWHRKDKIVYVFVFNACIGYLQ
jgi:hypothetical protein